MSLPGRLPNMFRNRERHKGSILHYQMVHWPLILEKRSALYTCPKQKIHGVQNFTWSTTSPPKSLPSVHDSAGVDPLSLMATTGLFPPPAIYLTTLLYVTNSPLTYYERKTYRTMLHVDPAKIRSSNDQVQNLKLQSTDLDTLNLQNSGNAHNSPVTKIRVKPHSLRFPSANTPTAKRSKERPQHKRRTRAPPLQTADSWSTHWQQIVDGSILSLFLLHTERALHK